MTVTVEANGDNNTALKDFMRTAAKLGRDMGDGEEALPRLAWAIVEAGSALSLQKDTDGHDDVSRAYAAYLKGRAEKVKHAQPVTSIKVQVSKLRQVAIAAAKPTCDFKGVMQSAFDEREALAAASEKVKAAYPMYVDLARKQQEQDDDLTVEQIRDCARKPAAPDKTVEKEIAAIEKRMEDLISGEKGVKFDDDEFVEAFEKVRACAATLTLTLKKQAVMAQMQALGIQAAA